MMILHNIYEVNTMENIGRSMLRVYIALDNK